MLWELLVVGLLILLNGFFAMSELALISARRVRLSEMAKEGSSGAAAALKLLDDQVGFLSTVQIGITLVGIFAGAYSGATLAQPLATYLKAFQPIADYADQIAFTGVVSPIFRLSSANSSRSGSRSPMPKRLPLSWRR